MGNRKYPKFIREQLEQGKELPYPDYSLACHGVNDSFLLCCSEIETCSECKLEYNKNRELKINKYIYKIQEELAAGKTDEEIHVHSYADLDHKLSIEEMEKHFEELTMAGQYRSGISKRLSYKPTTCTFMVYHNEYKIYETMVLHDAVNKFNSIGSTNG